MDIIIFEFEYAERQRTGLLNGSPQWPRSGRTALRYKLFSKSLIAGSS